MFDIHGLTRRYEDLCANESSKNNLFKELLDYTKAFEAEVRARDNIIDEKQRTIESYRDESLKHKDDLGHLRLEQDKLTFISVLVDGDGMNFQEKFMKNGKIGGQEAAYCLIQAVKEHVRKVDPNVPAHALIKIRVYANVEGLTKAYRNADIIPDSENLMSFVQGFNRGHELCDFVDVGSGKEGSDVKLRALFNQDVLDVHCRRVLFCGSADNGYAHLLRQHLRSNRITLVEGPPFAFEIREMIDDFETVSFDDVFMSSKLKVERRVSWGNVDRAITPPATPNGNYASAARAPTTSRTAATTSSNSAAAQKPQLWLCVNSCGERVDRSLHISSQEKITALKRRKLCNQHHLGTCHYKSCTHNHSPRLSAQELTDLMFIARMSPCASGLDCRDVSCIYGHRCPQHKNCPHLDSGRCKFDGHMHNVDTTITATIDDHQIS